MQRISSFIIFFCLMLLSFCAQSKTTEIAPITNISVEYKNIANQIMDAQYGKNSFDNKLKCWRYPFKKLDIKNNSGISNYSCVSIKHIYLINPEVNKKLLYIFSSGDQQAIENQNYKHTGNLYQGVIGVFAANIYGNKWNLIAANKGFFCGTNGVCIADEEKLIKIGKHAYAWVFSSGGTWANNVNAYYYNILSKHKNTIDDLSRIPEITEDDQKHEFSIKFIKSNKDYYDLRVQKLKYNTNIVVHSYLIDFDKKSWTYKIPDDPFK